MHAPPQRHPFLHCGVRVVVVVGNSVIVFTAGLVRGWPLRRVPYRSQSESLSSRQARSCHLRSWRLLLLLLRSTTASDRHQQHQLLSHEATSIGVVLLDYIRGLDTFTYRCTVLTNPRADHPLSPDWFPRARVSVVDGGRFRWINGEPGGRGHTTLPDGTVLDG